MTQLSELLHASFRGARFLIGEVSTEGGRKKAVHEFPNSDRREIDDLGLLNKTFSISGVVRTSAERDALIRALDGAGPGELVHPMYGSVQVDSMTYTTRESTKNLGEIKFEMTFLRSSPQLYPVSSPAKSAAVSAVADEAIAVAVAQFNDEFQVTGFTNFADAQKNLSGLADSVSGINGISTAVRTGSAVASATFGAVENNISEVTDFARAITSFRDGLSANIRIASDLSTSMVGMIQAAIAIFPSNPSAKVYAMLSGSDLASYGSSQPSTPQTTAKRAQRENNRRLINSLTQFISLAEAYRAAVTIEFSNADDLESVEKSLEIAYQSIIDASIFSDATNDLLASLREIVQELFDTATSGAAKIATINDVKPQPLTTFAYSLYAELSKDEELIDINGFRDISFIEGSVDILTP